MRENTSRSREATPTVTKVGALIKIEDEERVQHNAQVCWKTNFPVAYADILPSFLRIISETTWFL